MLVSLYNKISSIFLLFIKKRTVKNLILKIDDIDNRLEAIRFSLTAKYYLSQKKLNREVREIYVRLLRRLNHN